MASVLGEQWVGNAIGNNYIPIFFQMILFVQSLLPAIIGKKRQQKYL